MDSRTIKKYCGLLLITNKWLGYCLTLNYYTPYTYLEPAAVQLSRHFTGPTTAGSVMVATISNMFASKHPAYPNVSTTHRGGFIVHVCSLYCVSVSFVQILCEPHPPYLPITRAVPIRVLIDLVIIIQPITTYI